MSKPIFGKVHQVISHQLTRKGEPRKDMVIVETAPGVFVTCHIQQELDGKWYCRTNGPISPIEEVTR